MQSANPTLDILQERRPRIFKTGEAPSVLDVVRAPGISQKLEDFDSLLCESQTSGRGQYRRQWHSPKGNVHAGLKLPMEAPFRGTEAAVALGAFLCEGLRHDGWPCLLKWPNDLVLVDEALGTPAKVGGMLLEERDNILFAGVGINVAACPDEESLRKDRALPATSLKAHAGSFVCPAPEAVWAGLANALFAACVHEEGAGTWREKANGLLLWRNRTVALEDGDARHVGILRGVGPAGELLLEVRGRLEEHLSGSLCLAD